jgi:septal ring factor EnvC (AmiA/AmiB activator)
MSLMQQKVKSLQDDLNSEKAKNQELRQGMQTLRRDYEKIRGQLDAARRKAIGNDGVSSSVYQPLTEASQSSTTSAPQPFYAGVRTRCSSKVGCSD